MTTFTTPIAPTLPYDPFKHVNYSLGMVLGVEDFTQDFTYQIGHLDYAIREVIGYGTVTGLSVRIEIEDDGPQVVVEPGTAINPRGKLIRVSSTQCARLNAWLAANRREVIEQVGSPPTNAATLYVVLCYRECPVDLRPIPGEPCRDESETLKPSRLADDYSLELTWRAPDQRAVNAMRDFVGWMRQFTIDDTLIDSAANRRDFERAISTAVAELQSPPLSPPLSPPDFMLGSPPSGVAIPRAALCDYLHAAYRIWVTHLRPLWLGKNQAVAGGIPDEQCVLLAQLDIPLTVDWQVSDVIDVAVIEGQRPYVLPLQLVQEWMLCGIAPGQAAGAGSPPELPLALPMTGDVEGTTDGNTIASLQTTPVDIDLATLAQNMVLQFDGASWVAAPIPPAPPPEVPVSLPMMGDVLGSTNANTIANLQTTPIAIDLATLAQNMVLQFDGASWVAAPIPPAPVLPPEVPVSLPMIGDVQGTTDANTIASLQTTPLAIDSATLAQNMVLQYDGAAWVATLPPPVVPPEIPASLPMVGDVQGTTDANTIASLQTTRLAIDLNTLAPNMVLQFDGASWVATLPVPPVVPPAPPQYIVAGGRFDINGRPVFQPLGNLTAHPIVWNGIQLYLLVFDSFDLRRSYVVKGTVVNGLTAQPTVIEVIDFEGESVDVLNQLQEVIDQYNRDNGMDVSRDQSIVMRVSTTTRQRELTIRGFMIEISDVT